MEQSFPARQVERSIRKFKNLANDVLSARYSTWDDNFNGFLHHCETDTVMQVITEPLKNNPHVDLESWYGNFQRSGGMIGSKRYSLPVDEDDRLALLYQLLLAIRGGKIRFIDFALGAFGTTHHQDMVNAFNREVLSKFVRDVSDRLEDIHVEEGKQVQRENLQVFSTYIASVHGSNVIGGSAQGSILAAGNATISDSSASFTSQEELVERVKDLRSYLEEVSEEKRGEVAEAIDVLVKSAEGGEVSRAELAQSVDTVSGGSSSMKEHLIAIGVGAASELGAHGLIQTINFVLSSL